MKSHREAFPGCHPVVGWGSVWRWGDLHHLMTHWNIALNHLAVETDWMSTAVGAGKGRPGSLDQGSQCTARAKHATASAASASLGSLLEMQNLGLTPDPLNQSLHLRRSQVIRVHLTASEAWLSITWTCTAHTDTWKSRPGVRSQASSRTSLCFSLSITNKT